MVAQIQSFEEMLEQRRLREQNKRTLRALAQHRLMSFELVDDVDHRPRALCTSASGKVYSVQPDFCTCPDHGNVRWMGVACKHIEAARVRGVFGK